MGADRTGAVQLHRTNLYRCHAIVTELRSKLAPQRTGARSPHHDIQAGMALGAAPCPPCGVCGGRPHVDVIGQMSDVLVYTSPDSPMLAAIAETIMQTMNVPYVQIEMINGMTASIGKPCKAGVRTRIELIYRDTSVGWLDRAIASKKSPILVVISINSMA